MIQPPEPTFNTYIDVEDCEVKLLKDGTFIINQEGVEVINLYPESAEMIYQLLHARFKTKPSKIMYRNL